MTTQARSGNVYVARYSGPVDESGSHIRYQISVPGLSAHTLDGLTQEQFDDLRRALKRMAKKVRAS